jgi:hypothetical protein
MKKLLGLALVAWSASACVVHDHRGSGDSTLTVEWTIDGSDDPRACDDNDARYAEVTVDSLDDGQSDVFMEDCDRFGTDIDVPEGRYHVSVVLLDPGEHVITSTVDTDTIDLGYHDSDTVHVDFPNDSFR